MTYNDFSHLLKMKNIKIVKNENDNRPFKKNNDACQVN
ncbi:hypothetical protein BRDCF_p1666 [Bacteroidales bacterium CF]|nr:hypothetical protein BRDCF_p1666 [Bacteroidales bacterium CF]